MSYFLVHYAAFNTVVWHLFLCCVAQSSHIPMVDALMMAYTVEMISIEKVVTCVKRFSTFSASKELPFDLEDAMVFWINKVRVFRTVHLWRLCLNKHCMLDDVLIAYLHLSSPVGDFQCLARACLFMLAWRLLPALSKENCINLICSLWILYVCHNPFFVLQVNLKMREITEKEHKSKQHLLESPSHQKVPDIPAQEFHTCIVKLWFSVLFRPGFSHLSLVNGAVSVKKT